MSQIINPFNTNSEIVYIQSNIVESGAAARATSSLSVGIYNTVTTVIYQEEDYDNGGLINLGTSTSRITIPSTLNGEMVKLTGGIRYSDTEGRMHNVRILHNGINTVAGCPQGHTNPSVSRLARTLVSSRPVVVSTNDFLYMEAYVANLSSATPTETSGTYFNISKISGKCSIITKSTATAIASSETLTKLTFNTESLDTGDFANLGTFNDRLTIPADLDGSYVQVGGMVRMNAYCPLGQYMEIRHYNSSDVFLKNACSMKHSANPSIYGYSHCQASSPPILVSVGDYFTIHTCYVQGLARSIGAGIYQNNFWIRELKVETE